MALASVPCNDGQRPGAGAEEQLDNRPDPRAREAHAFFQHGAAELRGGSVDQVHRPKVKREKIQVPECIRLIDKTRQADLDGTPGRGALWSPAPPLPPHHSRHSGGGEGPGPLPTAGKRRAGDVTPVVHVSVLAVIATLLRHKTFFLRVLPCHR